MTGVGSLLPSLDIGGEGLFFRAAQFRAEQVGDKLKVAQFRRAGPPEAGKKVVYFKKYFIL